VKILVINPNTTQSMTDSIGEVARRAASPGTAIVAVSPEYGPRSIEGHLEEAIAAAATLEYLQKTRGQYDAVVIACYGDPALFAARELLDVPVVGIAEASMLMACMVAHRFSIVSVLPRVKPMLEDLVRHHGLEARLASVRCTELSVLEIEEDPTVAERKLTAEARRALAEDGAEAILLGCAGMGPMDKSMQAALGVPVIDGIGAAVTFAESLLRYGVTTSKVAAFKTPEPKEYLGTTVFGAPALVGAR
jgi:allantoin racemase